jgi:23S rRNA (guanosine2251-2'-O)-methyltransferase
MKPTSRPVRRPVATRPPHKVKAASVEYIYGKHAVLEAVTERPNIVKELYVAADFTDTDYLDRLLVKAPPAKVLNPKNPPRGISSNAAHQGVVAGILPHLLTVPYRDFIDRTTITADTALLVLGELQDPHNVGAVIRSAAAFGIAGILIPPHNQAPITGTVVKVSAGMAFRLPLVAISNVNTAIEDLKQRGCFVYGLDGAGTVSTVSERFSRASVFVLGNEGEGLRAKTREHCDALISIPTHPRCESLNAAAAAAVVMAAWSAQHPAALAHP